MSVPNSIAVWLSLPNPWELAQGKTLSELVIVTARVTTGGCSWRRASCGLAEADAITAAAWLVAERVMRLRTGVATATFAAWKAVAEGGEFPEGTGPEIVEPFVRSTFGLPDEQGDDNQTQGYVAEVLWYMLAEEQELHDRELVWLKPPDSEVTSPGADGFVVYRENGELLFRLWEIKKKDGSASVSRTVGVAYAQLQNEADRYLALMASPSNVPGGDEVTALFGELVPLWKRADDRAGVGVAVATNEADLPKRAFTTMHKQFPDFAAGSRLEGCLVGIGSLADFANEVRRLVWTGLSTPTP